MAQYDVIKNNGTSVAVFVDNSPKGWNSTDYEEPVPQLFSHGRAGDWLRITYPGDQPVIKE